MDPNAGAPQGDNANFIPPPLEETPSVVPPSIPSPQEPQVVQMPPVEAIPQQPVEPVNPAPVVDQPPTAPIPPVNTPPPEMPTQKSSPIFAIALTVLLVAIIGLAGYFLYTKYLGGTGNKEAVNTVVTPAPVVATPTPDPTADWKTYKNNYWGISFKYPDSIFKPCSNYPINEKSGIQFWGPNFSCPDGHDAPYKIAFVGWDLGKYIEPKEPTSIENIVVGGRNAQKKIYDYTAADGPLFDLKRSVSVVFTLNNGVIEIEQLGVNTDEQKAFDQILSTFKFVEASPSSSPISSSSPSAVPLTH